MNERQNQTALARAASSASGRANNPMLRVFLLIAVATACAATQAVAQEAPWLVGVDQIRRLDLLPAIKRTVKIGAVTSYDRTEGNDDGFSGKYSFIRKEGDGLVIADLKGPGCITRIHTPTPTDDPLEFYFDGEPTPRLRLPFRQLFTGQTAPFLRPLVDNAAGGYYSYVPILYQKSCKVVLRAPKLQFYDLNFVVFPEGAPVKTYEPEVSAADLRAIQAAGDVLKGGRSSDLTAYNVPPGTGLKTHRFDGLLQPGKSVTLFETRRGGRIASFRVSPADAFASKDRDIYLRITWDKDKQPSILCPAGDFFGYAWANPRWALASSEPMKPPTTVTSQCRSARRRRSSWSRSAQADLPYQSEAKSSLATHQSGPTKAGSTRSGIVRTRPPKASPSLTLRPLAMDTSSAWLFKLRAKRPAARRSSKATT